MAKNGRGLEKKESSLMFRVISPPHRWDQDQHSHYLRLTVPGFAAADISLHMDKYGHLMVRGSRELSQHKHLSFEETFDVPDDANLELSDGWFEDGQIYCITIPKFKRGSGDGGSKSQGVKLDDPKKADTVWPKPQIQTQTGIKFKKEIALLIVIFISIYVAWISRGVQN